MKCEAPSLNNLTSSLTLPLAVTVELTLNNQDFTSDGQIIIYRKQDHLAQVTPSVVAIGLAPSLLTLDYSYLFISSHSSLYCVFTLLSNPSLGIHTNVSISRITKKIQESQNEIQCNSPGSDAFNITNDRLDQAGIKSIAVSITVTNQGFQFSNSLSLAYRRMPQLSSLSSEWYKRNETKTYTLSGTFLEPSL